MEPSNANVNPSGTCIDCGEIVHHNGSWLSAGTKAHSSHSFSSHTTLLKLNVTVCVTISSWNVASTLVLPVTVAGTVHQLTNSQPSPAVAVIVGADSHVPTVITLSATVNAVPYSTLATDAGLTVHKSASLDVAVIVYLFTVLVYVAVYVVFLLIGHTVGFHPANVYVYCAVAALVGSAGGVGVSPSSSLPVFRTVPSQSLNVYVTSSPSSQL